MLMDMFYNATKGIVKHRRRYHFHEVSIYLTWKHFEQTVAIHFQPLYYDLMSFRDACFIYFELLLV